MHITQEYHNLANELLLWFWKNEENEKYFRNISWRFSSQAFVFWRWSKQSTAEVSKPQKERGENAQMNTSEGYQGIISHLICIKLGSAEF